MQDYSQGSLAAMDRWMYLLYNDCKDRLHAALRNNTSNSVPDVAA